MSFSVTRRKDRLAMAAEVLRIVKAPWAAEFDDREGKPDAHPIFDLRRVDVTLKGPHGLAATVSFDGGSGVQKGGHFVLSWHGVDDDVKLNPAQFQSVNPYHGHKATDVAEGFPMLLKILTLRMDAAATGEAFQ